MSKLALAAIVASVTLERIVDGERRASPPGTVLAVPGDLPAAEAERLVSRGLAKPAPASAALCPTPPADPAVRQAAIEAAVRKLADAKLEGGKPDLFTKSGAPKVKAVEALIGFDVEAEEVEGAWKAVSGAPV